MASITSKKSDRIFVRNGRRHYRRFFNPTENRIGAVVLLVLVAIIAWVAWKGAHPDPSLMMLETDLSQAGAAAVGTSAGGDRGPVPAQLAVEGWSEGELSQFDYENLFVKINGREGYYKSFGFEMLYFVSIVDVNNPEKAVDIELYNLGNSANAVGAYSGERSPGVTPQVGESGMKHFDRNAMFMTRGRYYLRAIGSEESPEILAQLRHIESRFEAELPGEPLPWGYALFVGGLEMAPGSILYAPENAFSFGFARNVYSAKINENTELFVTPADSPAGAEELAGQFLDGFRRYGADDGEFIKDRYQGTFATARVAGSWVVGFLRATDTDAAVVAMEKLASVVIDMPIPEVSTETPETDTIDEGYGSDEF